MIRSILWGLAFLLAGLLFQTTLLNSIALWGVKPNVILVLFFLLAVHNGTMASTVMGFLFGILVDYSSGFVPGSSAFLYTLAGYILGHWKGKIFFDFLAIPALIGFIATFFDAVVGFLISSTFNLGRDFSSYFNVSFFIQLLYNIVVSPLIWALFHMIRQGVLNVRRGGFDGKD